MTETEAREIVADALDAASVPRFRGSEARAQFVSLTRDIQFDELDVDSLAAMEICIAIEANVGVSLLPAELQEIGSLGALARRLESDSAA